MDVFKDINCKKKIVANNNYNKKVFAGFNDKMQKLNYIQNYSNFLKRITQNGCIEGYKRYGILDTYNNSFCISKSDDCPINKFQFDSSSKISEYLKNGYHYYSTDRNEMLLYYKKGVQKSDVIVSWIISESQPKYIDSDNFVLAQEAFDEVFNYFDDEEEDDDDDDDGGNYSENDDQESVVAQAAADITVDTGKQIIEFLAKTARFMDFINYIKKSLMKKI